MVFSREKAQTERKRIKFVDVWFCTA